MRFAVAAAGLVAVASASLEGYGSPAGYGSASNMTSAVPDTYVTEVYTQYTTYCPGPTSITHNGVTYTVTEVCRQNKHCFTRFPRLTCANRPPL